MRLLIVLAFLCPCISMCQPLSIHGKVLTEQGLPLPGATITLLRTGAVTITNAQGTFSFTNTRLSDTIMVAAVGYERLLVPNNERGQLTITLSPRVGLLDEAVVIAYGRTTRRFNTGNVSRLTAADISRQPVTNPLATLEGRIPGLTVVQSSGLPGAAVSLQLRGQSSIAQGSEPLFIIDGVPFAPGNGSLSRLGSLLTAGGGGGLSPFASLNPADIESIEVLKDADATAIYGSRAAGGVILITTRKGRSGQPRVTLSLSSGFSRTTRTQALLSTPAYLAMRREALANDGTTPTIANAPDLLVWDTTRYTDFTRLLTGGTARTISAQASLSGGAGPTAFHLSTSFGRESTVFPGSMHASRGSLAASINHSAPSGRFTAGFSLNYAMDKNSLAASGLAGFITLAPNTPDFLSPDGQLLWEKDGAAYTNPFAYLLRTYSAATDNLIARLQLGYELWPGLRLSAAAGANNLAVQEEQFTPIAAQNPATNPKGAALWAGSRFLSWLTEPQLTWQRRLGQGRLEALAGASFQQSLNTGFSISATGYTSDALIRSLEAAPTIAYRNNSKTDYRYQALFGRLNYNLRSRYLLNLSARRDGSSRFGPASRYATFGAIGTGWIFSEEKFTKAALPFLSYGKLRGSYGTTGSDQIGDYNYLDAWSVVPAYQGTTALTPSALFNPYYGWEVSKKLEAALELGLWSNRLLFSAAWFRHRSSSQLVRYALPAQTGFNSIIDNFPALVQNTGWELELNSTNIRGSSFHWSTAFNLTIPRNKLLAFPGIETSSYASTYVVGQPLSVIYRLRSTGVDPATGLYAFEDASKDGNISVPSDYQALGFTGPRFYGGLSNTLRYRQLEAHLFMVFKKQTGTSALGNLLSAGITPGAMYNQPVQVGQRWQQPGDAATLQRYSASGAGGVAAATSRFLSSDGIFTDASFARLKTLALAYNLPPSLLAKWRLQSLRIQLQGQNLFTLTNYKGADPENQSILTLPPLRTFTAGFQLTF